LYSRLDVVKRVILGKKYVCGIGERQEENMEVKCTLIIAMEND
jgi:hypothetical protein